MRYSIKSHLYTHSLNFSGTQCGPILGPRKIIDAALPIIDQNHQNLSLLVIKARLFVVLNLAKLWYIIHKVKKQRVKMIFFHIEIHGEFYFQTWISCRRLTGNKIPPQVVSKQFNVPFSKKVLTTMLKMDIFRTSLFSTRTGNLIRSWYNL